MYLSKIRVENYKSFRDSGEIEFKSGINIIVGQNNSGKTALLEALSMRFESKPHKNLGNLSYDFLWSSSAERNTDVPESYVRVKIVISSEEIFDLKNRNLFLPYIVKSEHINGQLHQTGCSETDYQTCLEKGIEIEFKHDGLNLNNKSIVDNIVDEMNIENYIETERFPIKILIKDNKKIEFTGRGEEKDDLLTYKYSRTFSSRIYKFQANRICKSGCIAGTDIELKPDGENLAEVLSNTHSRYDAIYQKLNKWVSSIFPSVKWVDSPKTKSPNGQGPYHEIRVWTVDKEEELGADLAFPLSECGTGIGQVLAILCVIANSKEPRTIIIDEPNSFLHPGATKKLIQILNENPKHQYFISTHSPEILSAAKPSTITQLKYENGETTAKSINPEQTKDLRETLDEIGVKFSDVFFSENILWVEGETEEKAFPLILEKADEIFDVSILPLVHTDDLRERKSKGQKHAKLVFDIYNRLSGANALTPPFVAVILDSEGASKEEIDKLIQTFGEKLKFIPQKMYENYLIDAEAITDVLNSEIIEAEYKVNIEQVETWIEEKRESKFISNKDASEEVIEKDNWLKEVHAANLLEKLFTELSDSKVEYRKTTHSVKLTKWFMENKPEQLRELKDFLIGIIKNG